MRAMIEEDDVREHGDERDGNSRVAPNFRAYGRVPTIEEAALYRAEPARAAEESLPTGSLQCNRITIGVGQFSRLGRKKRERFLCIELGLAELLEPDELELPQPEDEAPADPDDFVMLDPQIGSYVYDPDTMNLN